MKSVLLNTTVIGSSVKHPRHPKLIVGDSGEYNYGDILDANAVKKEIKDAVSRVEINNGTVQQIVQELEQNVNALVNAKIAEVVGTAPEALDTLKEIADALGNDPAFASKVFSRIGDIEDTNEEQDAAIEDIRTAYDWN